VVIVKVLDEPGTLADVALVMSKAGINIDSIYLAGDVPPPESCHPRGGGSRRAGGRRRGD